MGSLVDAGAIPYASVDVGAIRAGASSLQSAAGEVRTGGAAVVSAWRPIAGVYRGPGDAQLFSAMDPVGSSSTAFGDDLDKVAGALRSFADQVEPIVAKLRALRADAQALGAKVAAFKPHEHWSWMALGEVSVDSWDQDEALNNENNRIVNGVADQVVEYEAAERACANAIRSIAGLPPLHALTGAKDDPLGYGYSAIPAGTKLPWGQSADRQESCSEKTATFVPSLFKGIVVDGVGGTLQGLGQMVGVSVHDWKFSWSWDTVTTTWGAMGTLISYNPRTGQWGDWSAAGDAWTNLGKGTIAWDEWSKDPGAAAGATIFNVGSLLIPVVGEAGKVGAVGRVGEAAGDVSKLSRVAAVGDLADPASLVAKGAHLVLPKLSDLASALGSKFDDLKGLVSDHLPNFKDGTFHLEGPHAEPDVPAARPEHVSPHADQPVAEPASVGGAHVDTGHAGEGLGGSHSSGGAGGHGTGSDGHASNPEGGTPDEAAQHVAGGPGSGEVGTHSDGAVPGPAHSGVDHSHANDPYAPEAFYDGAVPFSTDEVAAQYGADYWNGYAESLSMDEQSAFEHYSMEPSVSPSPSDPPTYIEINGALRGGGPFPDDVLKHIQLMDKALAGRPTAETIIVTRGTGLSHIPESPDQMVGNIYSDPAYMSTSLGSPAFSDMEATLHLRVPPGTPALYLEKLSVFGDMERELLLARGVAYKVESVAEVDGHWHVYGEVVKP